MQTPGLQIRLLSNLISIFNFIIHDISDMRVQYEAFYIYLIQPVQGSSSFRKWPCSSANLLSDMAYTCPRVVETGMVLASANEYLRSLCGMGILCSNEDLRPKAHNAMQLDVLRLRCYGGCIMTIASNGSLSALYIDSTF